MRALLLAVILVLAATPALAVHPEGKGARSLGGAGVPEQAPWLRLEVDAFPTKPVGKAESASGATDGKAWNLTTYGVIETEIDVPETGVVWVKIRARGWHPPEMMNPHMHILVDGEQRAEWDVRGEWQEYPQSIPLLAGKHKIGIDNFNNYRADVADRPLVVDWIEFATPTLEGTPRVPAGGRVHVDAAQIHNSVTGQLETNASAREATQWLQWGVGCVVHLFVFEAAGDHDLVARLRGNVHENVGTHVIVRLDGAKLEEYHVGVAWEDRTTRLPIAQAGPHAVEICYDNDEAGKKRNLWLDEMDVISRGATPAPPAEPWSAAHATLANHRHVPSRIDADTVRTAREAWTYKAGGPVTGTPAVVDGVAYFGDHGGKLHAVRVSDGGRVWSVDHGAGIDSSVAVDGGRVLIGDAKGWISARTREDGELLWRVRADETEGTHQYGSPVVHDGVLYTGVASEQTLIEYKGEQTFRGSVAAFDVDDGKLLWRTRTQEAPGLGVSVWSTPAIDPDLGLLFVGTGNSYGEPVGKYTDSILALRLRDGAIQWSHQATKGDAFNARGAPGPDRDFGASPLVIDVAGKRLVVDGDKGGNLFALDRASGDVAWTAKADFKVEGVPPSQVEGFLGTASYHDGVLYAPTTARSMVHAFDAATGSLKWATELNPLPTKYGDRMFAPSTAADGVVLQGNAFGRVFALRASDGEILVNLSAGGAVQGGISLAGDTFLAPHVGAHLWSGQGGITAFRVTPGASPVPTPTGGGTPTPTNGGTPPGVEPQAEIPAAGLALILVGAWTASRLRSRR